MRFGNRKKLKIWNFENDGNLFVEDIQVVGLGKMSLYYLKNNFLDCRKRINHFEFLEICNTAELIDKDRVFGTLAPYPLLCWRRSWYKLDQPTPLDELNILLTLFLKIKPKIKNTLYLKYNVYGNFPLTLV